jgi:hypothetical protein
MTQLKNRTGAHNAAKTHCPQGHPYDSRNTIRSAGKRLCRACKRRYLLRYLASPEAHARAVAKWENFQAQQLAASNGPKG